MTDATRRTQGMFDGIHLYAERNGGLIEHTVDDSNDIPLTVIGDPQALMGWPTEAMVQCLDDDGRVLLVGCDVTGQITEVNH